MHAFKWKGKSEFSKTRYLPTAPRSRTAEFFSWAYLLQTERATIMQREAANKYARVEQEQKMSSGSSGRNTVSGLAPDNADLPLSS